MSAFEKTIEITNIKGLHARASAKFVSLATTLPAQITVTKDGSSVTGTSILGLMMLGAAKGDHITIAAAGEGAEDALAQIVALVEGKFGED
jgi:phosphocarrier protein HPr